MREIFKQSFDLEIDKETSAWVETLRAGKNYPKIIQVKYWTGKYPLAACGVQRYELLSLPLQIRIITGHLNSQWKIGPYVQGRGFVEHEADGISTYNSFAL